MFLQIVYAPEVGASKTCCRFIDGLFTPGLEELATETQPAYRPVLSQNPAPSRICTKGMNSVLSEDDKAVSMQSEAPLTLILSPLRAGRGEVERARLGSLFGDPGKAPPTGSPLPLEKGEGQGEGSFGYGLARGGRRVLMS